jgi:hypothetical protein
MADVTVFVDRAVRGDLPRVCAIDGVDTDCTPEVRQTVADGSAIGVAWLLLLAGPVGWIGLALIAARRSGSIEILTVELPWSERPTSGAGPPGVCGATGWRRWRPEP